MDQKQFTFQSSLGPQGNWEWVSEDEPPKQNVQDLGGGWGAEGSNAYKWSQYETPPIEVKKPLDSGSSVQINMEDYFNTERVPQEQSDNIFVMNIPLIGRIQFVRDKKGSCAALFVLLYWIYGTWSIFTLLLLPHYEEANIGLIAVLWYGLVSVLCILAFLKAVFTNPGRIPISAKTEPPPRQGEGNMAEYCQRCVQRRPATAHHCSKCGQCVRRMDHHCPWINNCVGEENRFAFVQLVMYAFLMSISALIFLIQNAYWWPQCESCKVTETFAMRYRNDLMIVCVILSSLMTMAGFGLCSAQMCLIRYDMTTLDFYKYEDELRMSGKAPWESRPVVKRSVMATYTDLCGRGPFICWFYPCRKRIAPVNTSHV